MMPNTVQAKLLLGWMEQSEALKTLKYCYFDGNLSRKARLALWRTYRKRVEALEPRNPAGVPVLPFTVTEQAAVDAHIQRINATPHGQFHPEVLKVNAADLVAYQYEVLTEKTEQHAAEMADENQRINRCLGVGMDFTGQLVPQQISPISFTVDLPHPEFLGFAHPNGCGFQEKSRYVMGVRTPGDRLLLWAGYHRTHAILCHTAGEGPGVAPLVTVMTGIPEVGQFFSRASWRRDVVLGERPALLRDFLDPELFIMVNLQKKRAEGRIEHRNGRITVRVAWINDNR
jgi:hypothetical protein